MTPLAGTPVLTAAAMRGAEACAIDAGATVDTLMQRAGEAVAAAVWRIGGGAPVLVLCGPGNNGGDGYRAAAALRRRGAAVSVAAAGPPRSEVARRAFADWDGPVETLAEAQGAPIVIDAMFGTGLSRAPDPAWATPLARLVAAAALAVAVDVPSGIDVDTGAAPATTPHFALTLALGAAKPAHLLQPGARYCGTVRVLDIGVPVGGDWTVLAPPTLRDPGPDSHKYSRGMVAIAAGTMAGAALLASEAAMRAGAGYVALLGGTGQGGPHALVHRPMDGDALAEKRIGALLIGPGLGRDDTARAIVSDALAAGRPLVLDGDALHLVTPARLHDHPGALILTPHAGEFAALFGDIASASKIDRAIAAARAAGAIVVYKGADTVIAAPDGRVRLAPDANDWLSTAGSGDVLAGTVAAMLAAGMDPLDAAAAGVWLHGDAARRAGRAFIADDLARCLSAARAVR